MATRIKRGPKILGALVLAIGGFFAVRYFVPSHPAETSAITADKTSAPSVVGATVVHMTGSSTIGQSLAPKLAESFLRKQGASDVKTQDNSAQEKSVVTGTVGGRVVEFDIAYPGSGAAFDCLAGQSCDIGMSSRPITSSEEGKLASLGNMHTPATEHVLAMDGIAVIVNPANRVSQLSVFQIGQIFLGQATNWSQVGGSGGTIHVLSRDKKSGTYDSFVHMALGGADIPANRGPIQNDNESVTKAVQNDPLAIGFVGLAYVEGTKALTIQNGDATPMAPSFFTVSTEDYALSRRLFLYTPASSRVDVVQPFLDYAISDEGQRVVSQVGFVALSVSTSAPVAPSNAPPSYLRETKGAQRLSFDFRFDFGGANLDGKALADLKRMSAYLQTVHPSKVAFFGFADNQGAEQANIQVSKRRAQSVASQLSVTCPQVVDGFGSALPVAPNDSDEGRARNRRVEVWVMN